MEINKYKQALEEEKSGLKKDLEAIAVLNNETNTWEAIPESYDPSEADQNSNADRFENYEEKSAVIEPLSKRLDEVEHALAKIETNNYGTCEVCGDDIEENRLNANPSATTCTAHMES